MSLDHLVIYAFFNFIIMDHKLYFSSSVDAEVTEEIIHILPRWRTHLCEVNISERRITEVQIKIYIAAKTKEEIKIWLTEYETITKTSHSIRSTDKAVGRYILFKQRMVCHHNTVSSQMVDSSTRTSSRNTTCPSRMTFTLHCVKKRYQGKDKEKGMLLSKMPCEINLQLIHNHNTRSIEALKARKPSLHAKETVLQLFRCGHSPLTALQTIKMDILLNNDDYKMALLDRNQCPDYQYCYHLYASEYKKRFEPFVFDMAGKKFLQRRLEQFNNEDGEMCAQALFCNSNFVICICSSLMKRVHKYISAASEIVFMNTKKIRDGNTLFVLTTYSDCGELPLAAFITSSPIASLISMAFVLVKELVGENIFGGSPDGPQTFVVNDSAEQQSAVNTTFPASNVLLCFFDVLRTVWKWLNEHESTIPLEQQCIFFKDFKAIMFAETVQDCCSMYEVARARSAPEFSIYSSFLSDMWLKRKQWTVAHRNNLIIRGNCASSYMEALLVILSHNILDHIKGFDVIQVVDFVLTKFITCYEKQLLFAAVCGQRKNPLKRNVQVPPAKVSKNAVVYFENTLLVPAGNAKKLFYVVNLDVLLCSCRQEKQTKNCHHVDWASSLIFPEEGEFHIRSIAERKLLYAIATNEDLAENLLLNCQQQELSEEELHLILYSNDTVDAVEEFIALPTSDNEEENWDAEAGDDPIYARVTNVCEALTRVSPDENVEQAFGNTQEAKFSTSFEGPDEEM